jgi:hypothetical protein
MQRNAGVTSMYVNGVQTANTSGATPLTPTEFHIGSQTGTRFFNGLVDDVRVYNRSLTSGEITQIYNDSYKRYFYLSDVYRASSGTIATSGGSYDPSTKQVTIGYSWPGKATQTVATYITRNQNFVLDQTDWAGGGYQYGPATGTNSQFSGWSNIDFATTTGSFSLSFTPTSGGISGYTYYRSLTVSTNTAIASGTLTNFPILVSSTLTSWEPTSTGGNIQNLCNAPNRGTEPCDLIFSTSASCSSGLNYETEKYTSSTGALLDWVQVPKLSAGTTIYACYGNSAVALDQSHPSSTWDSNYQLVQHLPDGSSLSVNDSTGINTPTNVSTTAATGKIDGGANFNNGSIQYIDDTNTINATTVTAATLEAWVKNVGAGNSNLGILGWWDGSQGLYMEVQGGVTILGALAGSASSNGQYTTSTASFTHVALVYDGSQSTDATKLKLYVNGLPQTLSSLGSIPTAINVSSSAHLYTGRTTISDTWNGVIDETRVSLSARSPSWIYTEYNNQSSPSTFYAVGAEL